MFKNAKTGWAHALSNGGYLLAFVAGLMVAVAMYGGIVFANKVVDKPLPGTGDEVTTNVVPANPGTMKALEVCQKGLITPGYTHVDGSSVDPNKNNSALAVFGASTLKWVNNPDYRTTPPGNQTMVLDGQPIVVGSDVQDCMAKGAKL